MLFEKNTSGQCPVCTSAPTSVPTAPASSGMTCSHELASKPGVETCPPPCGTLALLCTCHPSSPTIRVSADAAAAPHAPATSTNMIEVTSTANQRQRDSRNIRSPPSSTNDRKFGKALNKYPNQDPPESSRVEPYLMLPSSYFVRGEASFRGGCSAAVSWRTLPSVSSRSIVAALAGVGRARSGWASSRDARDDRVNIANSAQRASQPHR